QKDRIQAYMFDYKDILKLSVKAAVRAHIRRHYQPIFLEKNRDWEAEREYRWLVNVPNSSMGPLAFNIKDALKGVIVGLAFPQVYGPTLWALCGPAGITVERMYWGNRVPSKSLWTNSA